MTTPGAGPSKEHQAVPLKQFGAEQQAAIGWLATGIAHEINTPIQYVGDSLSFLEDAFRNVNEALLRMRKLLDEGGAASPSEQLDAIAKEFELDYFVGETPMAISDALEGVGRIATMVRAIRDFSHPPTGEMIPVDLRRAIESTITVAKNEWKYVADLLVDYDPALPPVPALPGELNQVLLDLIINAVHAIKNGVEQTGQKGRITIKTFSKGEFAEVHVSDTGGGIPEARRSQVFDPFYTTKEMGRGMGQGLAFAHEVICEKHAGAITFETEMGKGTTFVIRLPILKGQE